LDLMSCVGSLPDDALSRHHHFSPERFWRT
jgi:hypothetical protein